MSDPRALASIALGVFVAVVYPVLYGHIRGLFPPTAALAIPQWVKKYTALFAFCGLTAFIVLGLYRAAHPDTILGFWTAVGMGFGFEASVEKVVFPKSSTK